MSPTHDLDDHTKTCVYLPKARITSKTVSNGKTSSTSKCPESPFPFAEQLEAYQAAWDKCLNRIQTIVRELQAPVVSAVKNSIQNAYSQDVLPGLPYVELPVVAVSGGSHSVIADVVAMIDRKVTATKASRKVRKGKGRMVEDLEEDTSDATHALVNHVHPTDCTTIMGAMKAIVAGFVDHQDNSTEETSTFQLPEPTKRKPTTSLANFDIRLLETWYRAVSDLNRVAPQLVIVLHEFEQFDPNVMQDVFYICSKSIPILPLVFILDSSAPSTMAYFHAAYSRATIALLRVHVHNAPSGMDLVNTVIEKTFFDLDFVPDITLGPGTLELLSEFSSRHTASLDAIVTVLQLAHMKHFEAPLTSFVHGFSADSMLVKASSDLRQPSHISLSTSLLTRLWSETANFHQTSVGERAVPEYISQVDWEHPSTENLLAILNHALGEYRYHTCRMRLGFQVVKTVQRFMRAHGYKVSTAASGQEDSELAFMSRVMRGRISRDVKHLTLMIKKLPDNLLDTLLGDLYLLFHRLQRDIRQAEADAREFIVGTRGSIPKLHGSAGTEPDAHKKASAMSTRVSEWFATFIEERIIKLDQQPLWEIWNTGNAPFPSELVNPANRSSVVNALLHPHDIINTQRQLFSLTTPISDVPEGMDKGSDGEQTKRSPALWELPDTSILFKRYMEAGRMVNVYDLFEAFAAALDTQKEHYSAIAENAVADTNANEKGKGEQHAVEDDDEEEQNPETEEDEEQWNLEVHARFIRALHELDYMGFVKHTGRKADHIMRTVYDIPD